MTKAPQTSKKSWIRRHKWLTALAVLTVVAFALVQAVEYFVDVDRYREQVVAIIEERTEMPASIGELELALAPVPSITAADVRLGEGDLQISASQVRAAAAWSGLTSRQVSITDVSLYGLTATLPKDINVLRDRIDAVRRKKDEKDASSRWRVNLDRVRARSAKVFVAGIDKPVFEGDIEARDALADAIPITVDAALPFLGEPARLEAEVTVQKGDEARPGLRPSGWVRVTGIDPRKALDREAMPPLVFRAEGAFNGVADDAIGLRIEGTAEAANEAPELVRAAAGDFTGTLWLRGGEITLNDLNWTAPGLALQADLTRAAEGALACEVREARVKGDALSAVYAMVNSDRMQLVPQPDAAITASDVLMGVESDRSLRLVRGDVVFQGVQPTLANGATPFGDIRGKVRLDENVVHVDEVTGNNLAVKGTVKPDLKQPGATVDLSADVTLSPGVLDAFVKSDQLKDLSGRLSMKRIAGTFHKGEALPEDLQIDGAMENIRAVILAGDYEETLSNASGTFTAKPDGIDVDLSAASSTLGPVTANARIKPEQREIAGVVKADLANLNLPVSKDATAGKAAANLGKAYGPSTFDLNIAVPSENRPQGMVRIVRQGSPGLTASVALNRTDQAMKIGLIECQADAPLEALQDIAPETVQMAGTAALEASLPAGAQRIEAEIDLAGADLSMGEYVKKKSGDSAMLDVVVARAEEGWKPQTAVLHYGGEDVEARFEGGRIASDFDVDVGAFQNLFAETIRAGGRAKGSFKTNPLELDVALQNCALGLSETLRFDSVTGRAVYRNETPRIEDLRVQGLNSDFNVTLSQAPGGVWQGTVDGQRLDVDALTQAVEGFRNQNGEEPSAETPRDDKKPPPDVNLQVQLANVIYRNTPVANVRASVTGREGVYQVSDLSMAPGGGTVAGTAQVDLASKPTMIAMNLTMKNVDLAFVDGIAFANERGLRGRTDGVLTVRAPFGGGINPTNGATGEIRFVSKDGTLGQLGMATKVLTILRTTEILRLRAPSLRDEGLAFDACEGKATMKDGFTTIEQFDLKSPTVAMTAKGAIDFPKNQTNMQVDVHFLQMATQVLDIARLDDVAEEIRKRSSYRITLTGPPEDPDVSLQGLTAVPGATDAVKAPAKAGEDAVVDVIEGSVNILRNLLC